MNIISSLSLTRTSLPLCLPAVAMALTGHAHGLQQALFGDFGSDLTPVDGAGYRTELADIDGDGILDLVRAQAWGVGKTVTIHRGIGDGGFHAAAEPVVSLDATFTIPVIRSLALGDVDGDGDVDLLVGTWDSPALLLLNDGAGRFTDASYQLPQMRMDASTTTFIDVDADGDLDLFVSMFMFSPAPHALWINDGSGAFVDQPMALAASGVGALRGVSAVAISDFDGDGDVDLLLGGYTFTAGCSGVGCCGLPEPLQPRLLLNDGSGTFTDGTSQLPQQLCYPQAIAWADVDADGDLDIILGNDESSDPSLREDRLWLNDGAGRFVDASHQIPAHGEGARGITIADLDGDGDVDIVRGADYVGECSSSRSSGSQMWINDGLGVFTDAPLPPFTADVLTEIAAGDVDQDGDIDLVAGQASQARVWLNNGSASFVDATGRATFPFGPAGAAAVGDIDGDGDVDRLFGDRAERNDGSGWFDANDSHLPATAAPSEAVILADLDGDHDLDAIVARNGANEMWRNDGHGDFTAVLSGAPSGSGTTTSMTVGDVDGDGDLDLVVGNRGQQNELWLNDGTGTFVDGSLALPTSADSTRALALADLDSDGDLDLVVGNDGGQANAVALNDGTGVFRSAPGAIGFAAHDTLALDLADLDADGDLDLVLAGGNEEQFHTLFFWAPAVAEVWLNDGNGRFTLSPVALPEPIPVRSLALHDVDGDGHVDVLLGALSTTFSYTPSAAWSGQHTHLWLGDGAGAFREANALLATTAHQPWGFAAADIDEDGDIDVMSGSTVQRNLTRQVRRLGFPRIGRPLTLEINGAPGRTWMLATALGASRTPLGAIGTLQLERATLTRRGAGILDANGQGHLSIDIPADTALIGTSLYWQGFVSHPDALTNLEIVHLSGH